MTNFMPSALFVIEEDERVIYIQCSLCERKLRLRVDTLLEIFMTGEPLKEIHVCKRRVT